MEKILLNNIAEALTAKSGITREVATNFMHTFFKTIEKGLHEDGMVKVKGLGTFKLQKVSERGSVDVNTGERITIKGYCKVTFIPDSSMKEFVNRPFAHFEPAELNDGYPDEEVIPTDDCNNADVSNEAGKENMAEETAEEKKSVDDVVSVEEVVIADDSVNDTETEDAIADDGVVEESKSVDFVDSVSQSKVRKEHRSWWWFVIFVLLVFLVLATLFVGYFYVNPVVEKPLYEEVGGGDIKVKPNLEKELAEEWADVQVVNTQSSERVESMVVDSMDKMSALVESDSAMLSTEEKRAAISISKSLQAKNLSDITPADTTDYVVVGVIAVHKLKRGETIIQLSNKYYGDKRLWPYIVAYNRMEQFNSVAIGQEIQIPLLEEK